MDFELDFNIHKWPLVDQMDFERKVGMTVYKAVSSMPDEGEEWDVPAAVVVGLAWIAARRSDPELTFEQVASEVTLEDFMAKAATVVDDAPLENREQKRSTAKSSARSRTTSTTRPKKSAA